MSFLLVRVNVILALTGRSRVATLAARNDIGLGKREQGCAAAQNAGTLPADLPKPLRAQAAIISGYCAAIGGDTAAAGLAA